MAEAVAEVGSTANNYQILARLATGGMAEIFLARGVSAAGVERHCVLKRILRNRASDVSFVRMFLDEARLAAQLNHPNVAQVYDIGKLGDSYFFTMEYVHGETVRAIMQRARSLRRELPLAATLTIAAGAAAGLHHAHDRIGIDGRPLNIVHRDVSPSNLMVSYEGSVKVVDFGVAKAADRAVETRSGTVKGKISYLSPEQARGSSGIDRRADLFSLGIVLWEMLTTERLYKRNGDFENMTAIVTEPPIPPSARRAWIPPELDAIVLRLLAKDPGQRFQTADDLIEALEQFASRTGTMMSASALSRFLKDMFGQRPEPWVELDTAEVPEGVTVTSEPIPKELAIPVADDMDLQLSHVPKLDREEQPVPQIDDDELHRVEHLPTTPHPKVDPMMITTLSDVAPPPPRSSANTLAGTGIMSTKASGPQQRIAASAPTAPNLAYPRAAPSDRLPDLEDPPPRRRTVWQLVVVIALAAVVGSLTMWLVMRGRKDNAQKVAAVEYDAAVEIDAMSPDVAIDAAELEIDAMSPSVAIDAADPADAAPATVPADAAPALPVDAAPEPAKPDKPKLKKSEIETAYGEGRFKDVVTRCIKQFPSANADEMRCFLSACKADNEARARTWLGKLDKSKKKQLVNACRNSGLDLDPPKPDKPAQNPCDIDPFSCQH